MEVIYSASISVGGLLFGVVLMVLELILVFPGVVLAALLVTGPPVTGSLCLVADIGRVMASTEGAPFAARSGGTG